MLNLKRFQFIPFWNLTHWGFSFRWPLIGIGCDEWHNKSLYFIIPLVGEVVWFKTINRTGPEHIYGLGPNGLDGFYDQACDLCKELILELLELRGENYKNLPFIDILDAVHYWHTHNTDKPLHEFLGMSQNEYKAWFEKRMTPEELKGFGFYGD